MFCFTKNFSLFFYRLSVAIFLGLFLTTGLGWSVASSAPALANYYLRWDIAPADVPTLAKWDLLVLDAETGVRSAAEIKKIRALNPDIIILAYVDSQSAFDNSAILDSKTRAALMAGVNREWYLKKPDGNGFSFWPGTNMLNPTDLCPTVNGQKWSDYLANFVATKVLSTGLWDGVFFDNTWGTMTWFTGNNVDLNLDGRAEADLNTHWQNGYRELFAKTRALIGPKYIIVGNSIEDQYKDSLNGMMEENFQDLNWSYALRIYNEQSTGKVLPRINIINTNTANSGRQNDYQTMRYGLASTLLKDGYFAFDFGDKNHGQLWWYDEYNADLGAPTGEAVSDNGVAPFGQAVWRRDFTNGVALVNPADYEKTVDLGGEYEKLIGTQDKNINNGAIVDKITLEAKDGIIMRKTFARVENLFFLNGGFIRFYTGTGARARNGLFAFEENYPGGAKIFEGDLNSALGKEEVISVGAGWKIFDDQGRIWQDEKPLGTRSDFLNLGYGHLSATDKGSLVVAGAKGPAVLLTTYYGSPLIPERYPLGKNYRFGFNPAIGNVDGGDQGEVVLGTGYGAPGEVLIMDDNVAKIKKRFYPYGRSFKGGVALGVGDVLPGGNDEIVTAAKINNKILVRIFNGQGKKLQEFSAGTALGSQYIYAAVGDVDNDGRVEIAVGSS